MKKELVIEGCFDLFHTDHKAFIWRCVERFTKIYGYTPALRIRVMSNAWTHRKGPFRPFLDIRERASAIREYLSAYGRVSVVEAERASFEYESLSEFESEFADAVIAITRENESKIRFADGRYLVVEQVDRVHVTDIERAVLDVRETSCCAVRKVGAVLTLDGRVLSCASNTCTCATNHSCTGCRDFLKGNIVESRLVGCYGVHAEEAVLSSLGSGQELGGAILLSTTAPCARCAHKIIDSGVRRVVYLDEWERLSVDNNGSYIDTSGVDTLLAHGVNVRKAGA